MFLGCDSIACFSSYRSHKGVSAVLPACITCLHATIKAIFHYESICFFEGVP